jgi:hypothetical protein
MSDMYRVFGTQFDPAVVQGLLRQERQRQLSERNRKKSVATKRRKSAEHQAAASRRDLQRN